MDGFEEFVQVRKRQEQEEEKKSELAIKEKLRDHLLSANQNLQLE